MKRTPIDRPAGAELVRMISAETAELPPTRREPVEERPEPTLPTAPVVLPTEQINFRASAELARVLARLAVEHGSIRMVIAKMLRGAGHSIPDADLMPPPGRRRF